MRNTALLFVFCALAPVAGAQVSVDVSERGVRVRGGGANAVDVDTNGVAPEAQTGGVAVINGVVFIDGVKVPKGRQLYTSKKSGKTYRIAWGKDGNVSVEEK